MVLGVIMVTLGVAGGLYAWHSRKQVSETPPEPTMTQIQQAADKASQNPKENSEAAARQQNQTTSSGSGSQASAKIYISSSSQDASNLYISAIAEGAKSGTCTLKLSSGGAQVTKSVPLGLVTSYYACQGFTVSKSELNKGSWQASVDLSSGGATTTTGQQAITIN